MKLLFVCLSIFLSSLWQLSAAIPNDDFRNAIDVTGQPRALFSADLSLATREPRERNHFYDSPFITYHGRSVWWRWDAAEDGSCVISPLGGHHGHFLIVYKIFPNGAMRELERIGSQTTFEAEAGIRYYFAMVTSWESFPYPPFETRYAFEVLGQAPHDELTTARLVANWQDQPIAGGIQGQRGVTYLQFPIPRAGTYVIDSSHSRTEVYLGQSESEADLLSHLPRNPIDQPIFYSIDEPGLITLKLSSNSRASFVPFLIKIREHPEIANDHFSHAAPLVENVELDQGITTFGSGMEAGEPESEFFGSLWWSWEAPEAGLWEFALKGIRNSKLEVFEGNVVDQLTPVMAIDAGGFIVRVDSPGRELKLRITSFQPEPLAIQFWKLLEAENDHRATAPILSAQLPISVETSLIGSSSQDDEPGDRNIWWHWTAVESGMVEIEYSSRSSSRLKVFRGKPNDPFDQLVLLPPIPGTEKNSQIIETRAGESFLVLVFEEGVESLLQSQLGRLSLNRIPSPPGNHFQNRIGLGSKKLGEFRGSAIGMTHGLGDPDRVRSSGGSMWFNWICPTDGEYKISLTQRNPSLALESFYLYSGSELGNLNLIDSADEDDEPMFIDFKAIAGTEYQIVLELEDPLHNFHLEVSPVNSYGGWLDHFLQRDRFMRIPIDGRKRGDSLPDDGITNFTRYVHGLDPISRDPRSLAVLPKFTIEDGNLTLRYRLGALASAASIIPILHFGEVSEDGKNWSRIDPIHLGDRRFMVITPIDQPKKLLRLRIKEDHQ